VSVYLVSGLFALGGVGLAGLFAEIRASRDGRARENSELTSLKREKYSKGINQVELVASTVARWAGANDEQRSERKRAFWDELTIAVVGTRRRSPRPGQRQAPPRKGIALETCDGARKGRHAFAAVT